MYIYNIYIHTYNNNLKIMNSKRGVGIIDYNKK